jgi:AcrR family transcriptional regulator
MEPTGRRERKKAATRRALADAALRLFLERGFDDVGVREIAEAADVATTTLFKYVPAKEALVFDQDTGREEALVAAVRDRPSGMSIPDALRELIGRDVAGQHGMAEFRRLIENTPALREYGRSMWMRHSASLAAAIAHDIGREPRDPTCVALAHFALDIPSLISQAADPQAALNDVFALLHQGWSRVVG